MAGGAVAAPLRTAATLGAGNVGATRYGSWAESVGVPDEYAGLAGDVAGLGVARRHMESLGGWGGRRGESLEGKVWRAVAWLACGRRESERVCPMSVDRVKIAGKAARKHQASRRRKEALQPSEAAANRVLNHKALSPTAIKRRLTTHQQSQRDA